MRRLEGKVALITGAGSGIGAAAARLFAQEGAKIGALDFQAESVTAVCNEITAAGGDALPLVADVSDPAAMQAAVETLAKQGDGLHIVIANAGINGVWAPLDELEPEEWDRTMAINLRGTFLTFKYAIPHLRRQGSGGSAVITSSIQGTRLFSAPGSTAYACTKAAQVAFAKKAAQELRRDNIRVNVICPGGTSTGIHDSTTFRGLERLHIPAKYPEGRFPLDGRGQNEPEEVAQLLLFLASDESRRITGTEVWIDGGYTVQQD